MLLQPRTPLLINEESALQLLICPASPILLTFLKICMAFIEKSTLRTTPISLAISHKRLYVTAPRKLNCLQREISLYIYEKKKKHLVPFKIIPIGANTHALHFFWMFEAALEFKLNTVDRPLWSYFKFSLVAGKKIKKEVRGSSVRWL